MTSSIKQEKIEMESKLPRTLDNAPKLLSMANFGLSISRMYILLTNRKTLNETCRYNTDSFISLSDMWTTKTAVVLQVK